MNKVIIGHDLWKLQNIDSRDTFGVAHNFPPPIDDCETRWIFSHNGLEIAYSADGSGRVLNPMTVTARSPFGSSRECTTFRWAPIFGESLMSERSRIYETWAPFAPFVAALGSAFE